MTARVAQTEGISSFLQTLLLPVESGAAFQIIRGLIERRVIVLLCGQFRTDRSLSNIKS